MIFVSTTIKDAFVVELEKHGDDRGFFARAFCMKEFSEQGISFQPCQANIGFSQFKGTLRGIHYQTAPHAEAKLVRCTKGAVFDVVVDLRPDSPNYCQWFGIELTPENGRMLFIPKGCAHGYQTLEDNTELYYLVSDFYAPQAEEGLRWDDPKINIEWPITDNLVISDKDQLWPDF